MQCKECQLNQTDSTNGLCWNCFKKATKNWSMMDWLEQYRKRGLGEIEYEEIGGMKVAKFIPNLGENAENQPAKKQS